MTLFERTQSLEARARRQREQDVREEVAKNVRIRTTNLEKNLKQLESSRARAGALEKAGHERSPWPVPPLAAFDTYDMEGGAGVSAKSMRQDEWKKFVLALGEFVKKTEDVVGQDIKRAKKSTLEGISSKDLRGYLGDPSTENQAQQLLRTFEYLDQKNWESLSGPELIQVLQQASAFREAVVHLREVGASNELLQFLALARKDGAPVGSLTDTLRTELETRHLLGRLRLILK